MKKHAKMCENFLVHICEIWSFVKFGSQMPSAINGVLFSWFNSCRTKARFKSHQKGPWIEVYEAQLASMHFGV